MVPVRLIFFLQEQHAIDERFGAWRAAGHVDIHGYGGAVAAAHHGIGIVIIAAAIGAGAHGDHIPGLRHLVVDTGATVRRPVFVAQRTGHQQHVGLPRAAARGAEPKRSRS